MQMSEMMKPEQCLLAASCSSEAMIAMLTGSAVNLQPVYCLNGKDVVDGMRTDLTLASAVGRHHNLVSRQVRIHMINAVRYFFMHKLSGHLYLDICASDLLGDRMENDLLAVLHECQPEGKLVLMIRGMGLAVDQYSLLAGKTEILRSAGMKIGAHALEQGNLMLPLMHALKPDVLAMYMADRCVLPAHMVASILSSMRRMTDRPSPPVIADYVDSMVVQ